MVGKKQREYTIYQILVLCGDREMKHNRKLSIIIGKTENFISTWPTRGIPYQYWDQISELSGVSIAQICDAQAFVTRNARAVEMERYTEAKVDNE